MKTAILLLLCLTCFDTLAQYNVNDSVRLSGFGTFSMSRSDTSVPIFNYRNIKDEYCYDCDNTLGLQVDGAISDTLRGSAQIVKRPQDHLSSPELEWAYLAYTKGDQTAKLGRLRLPLLMSSEYYYVSAAYPWIRPPHNVYDNTLGITHYDGFTLEQQFWLADQTQIKISPYVTTDDKNDYELYGQSYVLDTEISYGVTIDIYDKDENQLHLAYLSTNADTLQRGVKISHRDLNLWSLGFNTHHNDYSMSAESLYQKDLFTNWYVSIAQDIQDWSPYIQYSEGHEAYKNQSYLVGLRYHVTPQFMLNLEAEHVHGAKTPDSGFFTAVQSDPIDRDSNIISLAISFVF